MDMTNLTTDDLQGTRFDRVCRALRLEPLTVTGRRGHSVGEIDKTWKAALKAEVKGLPMPSTPSREWSLEREMRLAVAKPLVQSIRRCDLEIERLTAERAALVKLLE